MGNKYHCNVIRSNRRSLSIQINREAQIIVRAPRGLSNSHIEEFLHEKSSWIKKNVKKAKDRHAKSSDIASELSPAKIKQLKKQARQHFQQRLDHFCESAGLKYSKMRLSSAKTRWGSCSPQNSINLNWKTIMAPPEVIDYLIVHELAHTKHRNHQKRFWQLVSEIDPNFKENRKWLRKNSHLLNIA